VLLKGFASLVTVLLLALVLLLLLSVLFAPPVALYCTLSAAELMKRKYDPLPWLAMEQKQRALAARGAWYLVGTESSPLVLPSWIKPTRHDAGLLVAH
jgi:hypothetical protein